MPTDKKEAGELGDQYIAGFLTRNESKTFSMPRATKTHRVARSVDDLSLPDNKLLWRREETARRVLEELKC